MYPVKQSDFSASGFDESPAAPTRPQRRPRNPDRGHAEDFRSAASDGHLAEPLDGLPGLARKDREKASWRSDVQIFVA